MKRIFDIQTKIGKTKEAETAIRITGSTKERYAVERGFSITNVDLEFTDTEALNLATDILHHLAKKGIGPLV